MQKHQKKTIPTVKHGAGGIILWACFSLAATGAWVTVEGIMNTSKYSSILAQNLQVPIKKPEMMRMNGFTRRRLEFWNDPGVNPIENLWDNLKKAVHRRCCHDLIGSAFQKKSGPTHKDRVL